MAEVAQAVVALIPSARGFGRQIESQIGGELTKAGTDGGKKFGSAMSSSAKSFGGRTGKVIGVGLLGGLGLAVAGIGAVLKTGFGEASDASAGTAQLAAGIKSTGSAANVSVGHLNKLASTIEGYSGQTDDSIVASEKLLLTFTNIKNKGPNKIFDLATQASADMAAKMGGDASGSAIQLGKALNDPVKGVGALSRVGVSFTAGQKATIASMVKTGNTAGAQKIILGELKNEFGGAAKAAGESMPGQLAKAKRAFEGVSQSVVEGLIPVVTPALTKVGDVITTTVIPAVTDFVAGFKNGTGAGGTFRDTLSTIGTVLSTVAGFIKQNADFLGPFAAVILTVVAAVRVWSVVQGVLNAVMLMNPLGLVVVAIAALVGALVLAYNRSATFRAGVDTAFKGVKTIVGNVIAVVITIIRGLLRSWTTVVGGILSAAANVAEKLHLPFAKSLRKASDSFNTLAKAADDKLAGIAGNASKWGESTGSKYAAGVGAGRAPARAMAAQVASSVSHALNVDSYTLGYSAAQGFASGIQGGTVLASMAAASLAGEAQAAMARNLVAHSPSRKTMEIGKWVGQGFAIGMRGTVEQVKAAAAKLAESATRLFTERIKVKDSALIVAMRAEVARLGPLAKKHKSLVDNLARARKRLAAAITHKGKAGDFGAAQSAKMMTGLNAQTLALSKLAKTRDGVAAKLKAAQDKLAEAVKVRNDFAASIKASVVALGTVVGIEAPFHGVLTGGDIVAQLKTKLAAATAFTKQMAKLKTLGLNNTAYRQLVEAGVEGGSASATALLAGGTGTIKSVNSLQSQMAAQGTKLGTAAAKTLYQAGVDSAKGLVDGLTSQSKALATSAGALAKALVKAVKKALGIRSPSKVLAGQVGRFIPLGIVAGIDSQRSALDASMRSLVKVPRAGSLDFASGSERARAVNGGFDYDRLALAMSKLPPPLMSVTRIDHALGSGL